MQNPTSIMTQAFEGYVLEVSNELAISDKRVYEMLAKDNPYPKLWRLLNPLGRINKDRIRLVKADFVARCNRLLKDDDVMPTLAELHRQTSEALQIIIEKGDKIQRKKEILEAIAELEKQLRLCEE